VADPPVTTALVVGFGSSLRGDDGLGLAVVGEQGTESFGAGVTTLAVPQLDITLAPVIAESELVIFVDARPDDGGEMVLVRELAPAPRAALGSHTLDGPALLRLTLDCYGRAPLCYLVLPRGVDFGIGTTLSEPAQAAVEAAREVIREIIGRTGAS